MAERSIILAAHFVLVPLIGQGHTIPMSDLACLLAGRGARVSLVATPANAARLQGVADMARRDMLRLEIVELPFPPADDGLPPGSTASIDSFLRLFLDLYRLAGPLEAYLQALPRRPSCIISDACNPWTAGVARSVGVPRLFFHVPSIFYSLCDLNVAKYGKGDHDASYVVPGMPVRVEMTKETWSSSFFTTPEWEEFTKDAREAMRTADGAVMNTFLDLEQQFVASYEAALGKPVWALGPFCLRNRQDEEAVHQSAVTAWLDKMDQSTVIYVNFGSLVRMPPKQLYEVGHGLEDSGKPFLWVVKESETALPEAQEWLQALEARTIGQGLVLRGWAPQLAIMSHRAVGGFVTHCGWNSLLESVAHGVPVVTWPHSGDQFLNERLAVEILGVGVPVTPSGNDKAVVRGHIARAVSELMGDGAVAEERRTKCKDYGEKAHAAVVEGGSSHQNLTRLLQTFMRSDNKEL
ncbi:Cytokinin-O-glucosyltransferase 1 [Hordeum vulgare]|uniref:Glycosyltransferase n=1 Tax=Hordeum vulgare subsp. vulgare TaxID=112509 RepID=A0A8I6XR84_HORVV|nr:UDP-glycosyltransferase 73C3-like [Hordeum vulgare subsp. vulgare]KAE8812163.1 Cytokinin-O-glucosyltransferase 1 [Hordeum vulgare]